MRAADSIGTNIAESYGRYHYGEELNFLYYARGSLSETKYWVRRCRTCNLLDTETCDNALKALNDLGIRLNAFIRTKRNQRTTTATKKLKESSIPYDYDIDQGHDQIEWLDDLPSSNYQLPNH